MLVANSGDSGAAAARHIKAQLGDLDSCAFDLRNSSRPRITSVACLTSQIWLSARLATNRDRAASFTEGCIKCVDVCSLRLT